MSSLKELKPFVRMHLQSLVAIYRKSNTIIEGYKNTLLQLKSNLENALQENKSNDDDDNTYGQQRIGGSSICSLGV
jgi:hypothetical protein